MNTDGSPPKMQIVSREVTPLTGEERALERRVEDDAAAAVLQLRKKTILTRIVFFFAVVGLWELLSGPVIDSFFVSKPSRIIVSWVGDVINGDMLYHAQYTLTEALSGYFIGTIGGIVCGFALLYFPSIYRMIQPFIVAFYGIPRIALAPLFILWFGIGISSKIAVASLIVFFVNFVNTTAGIQGVSRDLLNVVSVMGAGPFQRMWKIQLPSALPFIIAGLRVSVPSCMIGALVGEFISSNRGIGFMIIDAQSEWDIAAAFAAIFSILIMVVCMNGVVSFLEKRFLRWRPPGPEGVVPNG
ncbi:MAG: ABC transporter permease [Nitrospinota bacterium]|nr:ABC transporter permease [Nitrospinota bacterium]MDP7664053.1 ABC transporter permease [Nitrospinota bacterium]